MIDPPPPDTHDESRDANTESPTGGGGPAAGPPRWVKVFGLVGLVLVALILISLLTGHGPGRHMSGGLGGTPLTQTSAVEAAEQGGPVLLRVGAAS